MRMWEIREGDSHRGGYRDDYRFGDSGKRGYSEGRGDEDSYYEGYEAGYAKAMKDASSRSRTSW